MDEQKTQKTNRTSVDTPVQSAIIIWFSKPGLRLEQFRILENFCIFENRKFERSLFAKIENFDFRIENFEKKFDGVRIEAAAIHTTGALQRLL